ncbi:hypothetical protein T484DRAFT_1823638 [Baffinella frigidus]|nr:hypothetical protein T484DRAFT_1823638 [Cryptophyta sp. CCMP2293]
MGLGLVNAHVTGHANAEANCVRGLTTVETLTSYWNLRTKMTHGMGMFRVYPINPNGVSDLLQTALACCMSPPPALDHILVYHSYLLKLVQELKDGLTVLQGDLMKLVQELKDRTLLEDLVDPNDVEYWRSVKRMQEGHGDTKGDSTGIQSYFGLVNARVTGHADAEARRFFRLSPDHLWRRVDMWLVGKKSVPYAIMQYTGTVHFNRSLRHLANTRECMLSFSL